MKPCPSHTRRALLFLLPALSLTPALRAQDLSREEAERASRQSTVYRSDDGKPITDPVLVGSLTASPFDAPNLVPGRLLVRFKPGFVRFANPASRVQPSQMRDGDLAEVVPSQALRGVLRAIEVREMRQVFQNARAGVRQRVRVDEWDVELPDLSDHFVLELPQSAALRDVAQRLEATGAVVFVEPDRIIQLDALPTRSFLDRVRAGRASVLTAPFDPYYPLQQNLEQPNDHDINAEAAWTIQTATPGVRIGVIDTGIDYSHPDFGGAIGAGQKVAWGTDYVDNDGNPMEGLDGYGAPHGTHVAGIAAAMTNNRDAYGQAVTVAGVAGGWGYDASTQTGNPGATIVPLRVFSPSGASIPALASAIQDAANPSVHAANILNNSWGCSSGIGTNQCTPIQTHVSAFRYAAASGRVLVASSGNENVQGYNYPASYPGTWMFSVGAAENVFGKRASFSTYNDRVDFTAPGVDILSTGLRQQDAITLDGTSMAAPHVSGAAALIVQEFMNQGLSWHPEVAQGILKVTARDRGTPGYDVENGWGLIDAGAAVARMRPPYTLVRNWANGSVFSISGLDPIAFVNNPYLNGVHYAKRYEIRSTVNLVWYAPAPDIYCRAINAPTGWSGANPNHANEYCDVVSNNGSTVTLRTFVYEVWSVSGQYLGFFPRRPENTQIHYTVNGIPSDTAPLSLSLSGPDILTFQQTGTWTANTSGGTGAYTYAWFVNTGSGWTNTGVTTPSYSRTMTYHDFDVRVDVTSGSQTQSDQMHVLYQCDGGPDCPLRAPTSPVLEGLDVPATFALHSAAPNPARGSTTLRLDLPESAPVRVRLYDVLGREVLSVQDGPMQAGRHALPVSLDGLPAGLYVVRVETTVQGQAIQRSGTISVIR